VKYIVLLMLIAVHGHFFTDYISISVLLILYLILDACFRLSRQELSVYLALSGISLVLYYYFHFQSFIELLFYFLLFGFFAYVMNDQLNTRQEQRDIYERLLDEYRKLKRLNLAAENNARLEERNRIARDIHDSVGHRLTALIMKLETLGIQKGSNEYAELKTLARESLEDTRQAVKALQADENEGIATVVHLIRKLEAESQLRVQFTLNHGVLSIPITNEMSIVLYRVIQEALTNIMRHSESREAYINLSESAIGDIYFEIANPLRERKPFVIGFGIKNMRARVEEVNGWFQVNQTKDSFIISGTIPRGES